MSIDPSEQPSAQPGTVAYLAKDGNRAGAAYLAFARAVQDDAILSPKIRELILIGIHTALNIEVAFKTHLPRAVAAGATRDEIMGVIMLSIVNGGVQGALSFAPLVDELFPSA